MTSCVDESYRNQYADFLTTELSAFTESMLALMDKAGLRARYFFAGNGASAAIAWA